MRAFAITCGLVASSGCIELDLFECEQDCYVPTLDVRLPQISAPDEMPRALAIGGLATMFVTGDIGEDSGDLDARGDEALVVEWTGHTEVGVRMTGTEGVLHVASDRAEHERSLAAREIETATLVPFEAAFLLDDGPPNFVRFAGSAVNVVVRIEGDGMRLIDEETTVEPSWSTAERKAWDSFVIPAGGASGGVVLGTAGGAFDLTIPEVTSIDEIVPRVGEGLASPDEEQPSWKTLMFCFEARSNGVPVAGLAWHMTIGFGDHTNEGCFEYWAAYTNTLTVEAGGVSREFLIRRSQD